MGTLRRGCRGTARWLAALALLAATACAQPTAEVRGREGPVPGGANQGASALPGAGGAAPGVTGTARAAETAGTGQGTPSGAAGSPNTGGGVRIRDVQGRSHRSPLDGKRVSDLRGVVTATRNNGFWMQDPQPDTDNATSEALLVFTGTAPTVKAGDDVRVSGTVKEFRPGCEPACGETLSAYRNLTTTEITTPGLTVQVVSSGNALPPAVVIGAGGRVPPAETIEDDADSSRNVETSGTFEPERDGIDFWESLEGMLVSLADAVAVGPTNSFNETPLISASAGAVRTTRGGILLRPTDPNPERVILDDGISGVAVPKVNVGATFAQPVVGVLDYNFGTYHLLATRNPVVASDALEKEVTPAAGAGELSLATFNVENLDPKDPQSKFDALAGLIVTNLQTPDLLVLEEVQDNNGATNNGTVDAAMTLTQLRDAVLAAGGPGYEWRQIDPVNNAEGGEPGGNIRVVFFFRTDRGLAFVDRPLATGNPSTTPVSVTRTTGGEAVLSHSPGRVDPQNAAWESTRRPLAGEFTFGGRRFVVIGNHFSSKGGDEPLFGRFQPPAAGTEARRVEQARAVRAFVEQVLTIDPEAHVIVAGDLNDFEYSTTLRVLKGEAGKPPLHALIETLPEAERYSYVFEGNSETLDHILVSESVRGLVRSYDVVHVNSEFASRASDHDPQVVTLGFASPRASR